MGYSKKALKSDPNLTINFELIDPPHIRPPYVEHVNFLPFIVNSTR